MSNNSELHQTTAIEARQRANGCNQDNDPGEWGVSCCACCVCEREASLGIVLCEDCCENAADLPSKLCPGCEAYREHTGAF